MQVDTTYVVVPLSTDKNAEKKNFYPKLFSIGEYKYDGLLSTKFPYAVFSELVYEQRLSPCASVKLGVKDLASGALRNIRQINLSRYTSKYSTYDQLCSVFIDLGELIGFMRCVILLE